MGSTMEGVVLTDDAVVVSEYRVGYDMDSDYYEDSNGMTRLPANAEDKAAAFLQKQWDVAVA